MMPKLIARTRILCTDHPAHPRHEVRLYDDGSCQCECGADTVTEARKTGVAMLLGAPNLHRRSCKGLIAFVTVGLPRLVSARIDDTGNWGGWESAWIDYAKNAVVREAYATLICARDAKHAETLKAARRALLTCSQYRNGMSARDLGDCLTFLPDSEMVAGSSIALFTSDEWRVPLQKDWLESVGKAKPVIDGRFVVGVSEHPGFFYAIDGSDSDGFAVREFALINGKLGLVAK